LFECQKRTINWCSHKLVVYWCSHTGGVEMSAADQYRRNASECVAITAFFTGPQQRAAVLALAEAWTRLAEQADKNEEAMLFGNRLYAATIERGGGRLIPRHSLGRAALVFPGAPQRAAHSGFLSLSACASICRSI
jgi:hypothetical protein